MVLPHILGSRLHENFDSFGVGFTRLPQAIDNKNLKDHKDPVEVHALQFEDEWRTELNDVPDGFRTIAATQCCDLVDQAQLVRRKTYAKLVLLRGIKHFKLRSSPGAWFGYRRAGLILLKKGCLADSWFQLGCGNLLLRHGFPF
jgi:hypothetical protein